MSHAGRWITIVVSEPGQYRQEEVDEAHIHPGDSNRSCLQYSGGDDNGCSSGYLAAETDPAEVAVSPCTGEFFTHESTQISGCATSWKNHTDSGCCWCAHHQLKDAEHKHLRGNVAAEDIDGGGEREESLVLHVERAV